MKIGDENLMKRDEKDRLTIVLAVPFARRKALRSKRASDIFFYVLNYAINMKVIIIMSRHEFIIRETIN